MCGGSSFVSGGHSLSPMWDGGNGQWFLSETDTDTEKQKKKPKQRFVEILLAVFFFCLAGHIKIQSDPISSK